MAILFISLLLLVSSNWSSSSLSSPKWDNCFLTRATVRAKWTHGGNSFRGNKEEGRNFLGAHGKNKGDPFSTDYVAQHKQGRRRQTRTRREKAPALVILGARGKSAFPTDGSPSLVLPLLVGISRVKSISRMAVPLGKFFLGLFPRFLLCNHSS